MILIAFSNTFNYFERLNYKALNYCLFLILAVEYVIIFFRLGHLYGFNIKSGFSTLDLWLKVNMKCS